MATKNAATKGSSSSLKTKRIIYSTEAAAISIAIHVILIVFAGSWVAIQYKIKHDAELRGENVNRPKLERRQLQMPVKAQKLQRKSSRPKVTTRMAAAVQSSFSLPDMMGLDSDLLSGFDRDTNIGERSLSSMGAAGSLGFGISGVNFFGAKSKGEKMVFVLGTDANMVTDDKGGFYTYEYAKKRIVEMIDGMRAATLFNVMVYNKFQTAMFSDKLVPATAENRDAVKQWLDPVNKTDEDVGQIKDMKIQYESRREYEGSPLNGQLAFFTRSIQAAMEQKADNIFVLAGGYDTHHLSDEAVMERFNVEDKEEWLEGLGWSPDRIAEAEREAKRIEDKARKQLEQENKAREAAGQPRKFISGGIWKYISQETDFKRPERPPSLMDKFIPFGYTPEDIIEHLELVYRYNYLPQRLDKPSVHIVKVVSSDGSPVNEPQGERETYQFNSLKKIPKAFDGRFELLRGAKTMEDILRFNKFD